MAGAYLGAQAIPEHLTALLEDQGKGISYIRDLGDKLWQTAQQP